MTWPVVLLAIVPEAHSSWDRTYLDEEEIIDETAHEERTSLYQTSFEAHDPERLWAQTRLVERCERWTTQTVEIRQVLLETKTKKDQVVQSRRTVVGDPRTVERDTPRASSECGEQPAVGLSVAALGQERQVDPEGRWSIALSQLRSDQLTSLSRGTIGYTLRTDAGPVPGEFSDEARAWAAAGRTRLTTAQPLTGPAEALQLPDWPAPSATPLSRLVEAYQGPWAVRSERDPLDDSQTLVLSRSAEGRVPAWRRTAHPVLHARCTSGEPSLLVHLDTRAAVDRARPDIASVVVRLDDAQAQELELIRSDDGEALFFDDPQQWMLSLTQHGSMLFRFEPHLSDPVDAHFDLTGFSEALGLLATACSG